jgi:iron complex transport system substrate-binding protein
MLKAFRAKGRACATTVGACALTACLAFALTGCDSTDTATTETETETTTTTTTTTTENEAASSETITFIDDLGREVQLPAQIDRMAPSGHTAQQVLLTIAPEKLVGLSKELNDEQLKIFGEKFATYEVFGAVLGASDDLNREAIAAADPQVIIDTGEAKSNAAEELDALQDQVGIPVVFIEAKLSDYGSAYEKLGTLLGVEERGKKLAEYCTNAYSEVTTVMDSIAEEDRVKMAYLLGDKGTNAIAQGSFQGSVVDLVATNVVVVDDVSSKGSGNEISLEQLAVWDPELIVFQEDSVYDTVAEDAAWSSLTAIKNGNYYEVPNDPWCWLNNPPTVNQIMGLQWLPRLLYADKFDTSIEDVTRSYYSTMYSYELSDEELTELVKNALPKV